MFLLIVIGIVAGGALLATLTWYLTKRWPTRLRLVPTSLIITLAIAPGIVVGHGIFFVPFLMALFGTFAGGADQDHSAQVSFIPVVLEWIVVYLCLAFAVFICRRMAAQKKLSKLEITGLMAGLIASASVLLVLCSWMLAMFSY
jgi:hypothetical protein